MNATTLMLVTLLSAPASPTGAVETGHPLRVTNERGTAVIFTAPSIAVNRYITNRHRLLDRLATRTPDAVLEAQISFSHRLNADELMKELDNSSVTVRTLNLDWDGQSGGFGLRENERLEDGLTRLHRHHGEFINETKKSRRLTKEEARREGARPEDKRKHERHARHVDAPVSSHGNHRVLFIGARVRAPASRLRALRDRPTNIRLVDPLWDELSDASGVSKVRKIAMPLVPDVE